MSSTKQLIEALESRRATMPLDELYRLASTNKVGLELLRRLNVEGGERRRLEWKLNVLLSEAKVVEEALKGIPHAFIKLRKPLAYVPADVDLLVHPNAISLAVKRLLKRGFKVEVLEPYTVTMVRRAIVDLYVHPNIAGIAYLYGPALLDRVEEASIEGYTLPTLDLDGEVIATATHAVYKEQIFTLSDYYVLKHWLKGSTWRLAEELRSLSAIKVASQAYTMIELGLVEAPLKLPIHLTVKALTSKLAIDPLPRSTVKALASKLRDPRLLELTLSRLRRSTY